MNRKTLRAQPTVRCAVYIRYNAKQSIHDHPVDEQKAREMVTHHPGCILLPDHIYLDIDQQWIGLAALLEAALAPLRSFDCVFVEYLTDLGDSYSSAVDTLNQLTRCGVMVKFGTGQMDSGHPAFAVTLSAMTGYLVDVFDGMSRR